MIIKPADDIQDGILREHVRFLQENVQGNILSLSSAPTATEPLLQDNESGVYSNILYVRKVNKIYVFNPTSTITIT